MPSASASRRTLLNSPSHFLRVGGFVPMSTCDWPGELVATVFCQGCGWDCVYCHNPDLIPARAPSATGDAEAVPGVVANATQNATGASGEIAWSEILAFLGTRRGLLDGVVFSGGEPLVQSALVDAIADVRALGYRVALHTSGQMPARLAQVLPEFDWVGLDIKAPHDGYERITGIASSGDAAFESLTEVVASGVPFEVRTTVHSALLDKGALTELAARLREAGVRDWVLQPFRATGARPERLPAASATILTPELVACLREGFRSLTVRD